MTRRATIIAGSLAAAVVALSGCSSSKHTGPRPVISSVTPPSSAGSAQTETGPPASSATTSTTRSASDSPSGASAHPAAVWPTYHHDNARTGDAGKVPAVTALKVAATAQLDGALYASPLVLRDATGPIVIAATENDTLYALRNDGSVVWKRHVGMPVDGSTLPCGNIDPTGITGTPAYDAASGLVFAVAFVSGDKHELVALNAETGAVAWTRPVDPPGSHPNVEQQRAALLVSSGRIWVAYGGLEGDCGPYHGYVVGIATSGQGAPLVYQVPSAREAGIWTAAGPAADDAGHIYVSVGNGAETNPNAKYDMSDSVIELDASLHVVSYFAPSTWAQENSHDLDLGTTGPMLIPGSNLVFVAGKAGSAYLLTRGNLGGLGAKVPTNSLCTAFGGAAVQNSTVFVPCTNGVRSLKISGTTMTPGWKASPAGSPVIGGGAVLSVDAHAGVLYALDPGSGAVKAKVPLGSDTNRFVTPAFGDDGHAYVGTQNGTLVIVATS